MDQADDRHRVQLAPALKRVELDHEGVGQHPSALSQHELTRRGCRAAGGQHVVERIDRVDDQMVDYLKQNAIEGPWATGERLIVCVGPDALSEKVVRVASRLASGLNAPWIVVSIERADRETETTERLQRMEALGLLRNMLGPGAKSRIRADLSKDLLDEPAPKLRERLNDLLRH